MSGSPVEWRIAVAACDGIAMSDLMRRMYENAARIVPSTRYFCGDCGTCGLDIERASRECGDDAGQWEIEIWNVAQGLSNPFVFLYLDAESFAKEPWGISNFNVDYSKYIRFGERWVFSMTIWYRPPAREGYQAFLDSLDEERYAYSVSGCRRMFDYSGLVIGKRFDKDDKWEFIEPSKIKGKCTRARAQRKRSKTLDKLAYRCNLAGIKADWNEPPDDDFWY